MRARLRQLQGALSLRFSADLWMKMQIHQPAQRAADIERNLVSCGHENEQKQHNETELHRVRELGMGARASHWSGWQSDTGPLVPAHYHARSAQWIRGQNHRARSLPINQLDALVIHLHPPQPRLTTGAFLFPSARRAPPQTPPRLAALPAWATAGPRMLTPGILEPVAFQAGSQSHDVALWRAFPLALVCSHQGSSPTP